MKANTKRNERELFGQKKTFPDESIEYRMQGRIPDWGKYVGKF